MNQEIYKTLSNSVNSLKEKGAYRVFNKINRVADRFPRAIHVDTNKEITIWCSNDYLGMGQNKFVRYAMIDAINNYGAGAGGSRNIGGSNSLHSELEQEIANFHNKESGLIFPTGFASNDVTISCLTKLLKNCVFLSDEMNHASIINGMCQNSGIDKRVFKHNDCQHLETLLKAIPRDQPKIIIFESVYSMDGDIAPIMEICNLAKKYNALTYLDEVHAVGLYGSNGAGMAAKLGLSNQIDIIQGTFAKAFGVIGGYIVGNLIIIDAIRSFGTGFIFTTALQPSTVAGILAAVKHLKTSDEERIKLHEKTNKLRNLMKQNNIPLMECSTTHILPVKIGNSQLCTKVANHLLTEFSIYIQPINSPTVPEGTERLRINASPHHTEDDINHLIKSLTLTLRKYKLISA